MRVRRRLTIPPHVQAYSKLQDELLALSSNHKHVAVENSGHYIMVDRPDAVIEAIREAVEVARGHGTLKE